MSKCMPSVCFRTTVKLSVIAQRFLILFYCTMFIRIFRFRCRREKKLQFLFVFFSFCCPKIIERARRRCIRLQFNDQSSLYNSAIFFLRHFLCVVLQVVVAECMVGTVKQSNTQLSLNRIHVRYVCSTQLNPSKIWHRNVAA